MKYLILLTVFSMGIGCTKQEVTPVKFTSVTGQWHYNDATISLDVTIDDTKHTYLGNYTIQGKSYVALVRDYDPAYPLKTLILDEKSPGSDHLEIIYLTANSSFTTLSTDDGYLIALSDGIHGTNVTKHIEITRVK